MGLYDPLSLCPSDPILDHYGQSLMNRKDMQEALQRLRSLTALETRAISSETRVDVAECRKMAEEIRLESTAMKLGTFTSVIVGSNVPLNTSSSYP